MFWIGLSIVVALVILVWNIVNGIRNEWEGVGFGLFIGVAMGGLAAMIIVMVGGLVTGAFAPEARQFSHETPIVAAVDNTMMDGHFYLFGGTIDEEPVYSFYRQSSDGAIRQGRVPVDSSVIYEDQEDKGFIKVYNAKCVDWSLWYLGSCTGWFYEIHVPEDSVTRGFEFDLN